MSTEQRHINPEQRESLERHTEIFEGVNEAINLHQKICEGVASAYQDVKDGKIESVDELEKSIEGVTALNVDRLRNNLDEGTKAHNIYKLADVLLDPSSGLDPLEHTTLHSMNTLLEMAWEIKDSRNGENSVEKLADDWGLTSPEKEMVTQFSKMKTSEFDEIQRSLVDSGLAFAVREEVQRIIVSGELPPTTEEEEAAKVEALKLAEKKAEWEETKRTIVEAHEDLESVDFTPDNVERALGLANMKRREILAVLRTSAFVNLEDIPELTTKYTMDNLEDSDWLLGFLIKFDSRPRRDLFTTKDKKFHAELEGIMNSYLGTKLHEHREGLLKGFVTIYGATLTDPKSDMHKETFTALHSLARETDGSDEDDIRNTGAIFRAAFNKHYSVRIDSETKVARGDFKTEEAKTRFKELWGEYSSKGKQQLSKIGKMIVSKQREGDGSRTETIEADDSESKKIDIDELIEDIRK